LKSAHVWTENFEKIFSDSFPTAFRQLSDSYSDSYSEALFAV